MPQATFYTHVADREHFTCRLIERAIRDGGNILVWSDSSAQIEALDKKLWQYRPESFVPHEIWHTAQPMQTDTPVLLASGTELPELPPDMTVLNLSPDFWNEAPVLPARVLEIVGNSFEEIDDARRRFSAYRKHGFDIEHHSMEGKA